MKEGAVYRSAAKRKRAYSIKRGTREAAAVLGALPDGTQSVRAVSAGGFSSINLIVWIAMQARIGALYATTLRVGKKHAQALGKLHEAGRLDKAHFVVGSVMRNNVSAAGKDYAYDAYFEALCARNGWTVTYAANHSKIILLDTERGEFVIETSSNLNENPKAEQFCIEQDAGLFEFYRAALFGGGGARGGRKQG